MSAERQPNLSDRHTENAAAHEPVLIPISEILGEAAATPQTHRLPTANDWLLWQLADSAFPTGGFAHSAGLEAAWQHGEIRNRNELASFIDASLNQFGHASIPFMAAAHKQSGKLPEFDDLCHVFLSNHVANRASRLQGQALLASARRIFHSPALDQLQSFPDSPSHGHLAPIFGAVTAALGVSLEPAASLFLFIHLRGLFAGAVRLGIVGPMEAQSLQHEFSQPARDILDRSLRLSIDDIAQTAPLQEIWQGAQDRLYSRLFQS